MSVQSRIDRKLRPSDNDISPGALPMRNDILTIGKRQNLKRGLANDDIEILPIAAFAASTNTEASIIAAWRQAVDLGQRASD